MAHGDSLRWLCSFSVNAELLQSKRVFKKEESLAT